MTQARQTSFAPVDPKQSVDERERAVQAFWEDNAIFEKSVAARADAPEYAFYDGPPFATGLPHYGHMVGQTLKDVVPRYQTMRGKRVKRVWGWDCHGLPIENIVEKEMGSQAKKDIEALGVAKFNAMCRSKVLAYADAWEEIIPRIGRWVDMKKPYRTMDRDYMESVWWVFKRLWDKGLVYESYRAMHICPRCETTLSQSEVSEGYKEVKDLSVVAQFAVRAGQTITGTDGTWTTDAQTFILAWTTTPWTLPGNVALAVGAEIAYVVVEMTTPETRFFVVVSQAYYERNEALFDAVVAPRDGDCDAPHGTHRVVQHCTGADLAGLTYAPLYDAYARDEKLENRANGWQVYTADFVTTDEGTGVVHIAPAFGEDDMALGKEKHLPFVQHVGMDGVIKDAVGAPLAGLAVKPKDDVQATDVAVIKDLARRGRLFHKEKYAHNYPHCWRCDTPLLNYATSSWFVAVTKIKDKLLDNARHITWSPAHLKKGRFGKWLHGARDWSISRQRFWASVIPVWVCDACGAQEVFGAVADLEARSGRTVDDLHKHVVDTVTFACAADGCDGTMRRVPDVLDTWFDSGAMPYAQEHYPFAHDGAFVNKYPADFIAEGVDQTRAWFYYLHVLAGALEVGGPQHDQSTHAFCNVIVNGTVLAEDGRKMSKSLQNYPDPMLMVQRYGADALRLYLLRSPVVAAEDLRFSERALAELARGFFRMVRQSYSFFVMYASVDGWRPRAFDALPQTEHYLDRWIVARLQQCVGTMRTALDAYDVRTAARAPQEFVDDLSNWYIRRSRKRFWKSEDDDDKAAAYATLHYVLVTLARALAPLTPFVAEEIYRNLTRGIADASESVHLTDYPELPALTAEQGRRVEEMAVVREVISRGLELRAQSGIKVRQPLVAVTVPKTVDAAYDRMICEELNVKRVRRGSDDAVTLDTAITPALALEGQARELIRHIQQARKKAGFAVDDRIALGITGTDAVVDAHAELIAHETLVAPDDTVRKEALSDADYENTVVMDGSDVGISIKRNA